MEEAALTGLIEYGVLGLWTISLLWSQKVQEARHAKQIERMEERHQEQTKDFLAMRERIHAEVVEELKEISHKLDMSLTKISDGLTTMREKHAEDRLMMLQAIPKKD